MTKEVSAVQVDPKGPSRNRCARFLDPLPSLTRRPGRRGARLARREEGAYRVYATDEQRSQAGCIGVQDWHRYSVTGPKGRRISESEMLRQDARSVAHAAPLLP